GARRRNRARDRVVGGCFFSESLFRESERERNPANSRRALDGRTGFSLPSYSLRRPEALPRNGEESSQFEAARANPASFPECPGRARLGQHEFAARQKRRRFFL